MTGSVPERRSGHTLTCVKEGSGAEGEDRKAVLFGGKAVRSNGLNALTNDLYAMDLNGFEWEKHTPSESPEPRSKHSATPIGPNMLCVFGGCTLTTRLNDCWILDTVKMTWTKVESANAPSPRGGHAACMLDDKMYIIFGYGGVGYSRRDLADINYLDMTSKTWATLTPDGEPPHARSAHQASVVEKRIFVSGGWNSSEQLSDIHILDLEANSWSEVAEDFTFDQLRWDHSTVAVWAVPNWKVFIFGGNSGDLGSNPQGTPLNDVKVIDTGDLNITSPICSGDNPSPRSDSELLYDQETNR